MTAPYILETERLWLREITADDAAEAYRLNLDPDVIRYTGDDAFESVEEAQKFLASYPDYQKNGFGRWAVIRKKDLAFLGWCGLKYDAKLNETDIGFRFFKTYWNNGYATESASACLRYGFEKLKMTEIVGRAMHENHASIAVLEKIGLKYTGDEIHDLHPARVFRITREEFLHISH